MLVYKVKAVRVGVFWTKKKKKNFRIPLFVVLNSSSSALAGKHNCQVELKMNKQAPKAIASIIVVQELKNSFRAILLKGFAAVSIFNTHQGLAITKENTPARPKKTQNFLSF